MVDCYWESMRILMRFYEARNWGLYTEITGRLCGVMRTACALKRSYVVRTILLFRCELSQYIPVASMTRARETK